MDIRHLKTLVAIADHGTFGAAGRVVGLTQSAVSQQIHVIEDHLLIKLFDRTKRPPVLTTHGITLLEGARKIVREYERITSSVTGDQLSGNLVLGAIRTSFTGALPQALSILRERYPRLRIHVKTEGSSDLVSLVAAGRLDAAVIPGEKTLTGRLCWLPFTIEPLKVIAFKGTQGLTDRELLESHPYLRFKRNVPVAHMIDDEIRRRNIRVTEEMQIDTFAAIIVMVSHGLGVAITPEQAVEKPFPPNIRTVPFGDPPLQRIIGIIHKETSTKIRVIEALHYELCRLSGSPEFIEQQTLDAQTEILLIHNKKRPDQKGEYLEQKSQRPKNFWNDNSACCRVGKE